MTIPSAERLSSKFEPSLLSQPRALFLPSAWRRLFTNYTTLENSSHLIDLWSFLRMKYSSSSNFSLVIFNKSIIPLVLLGYEMIVAWSRCHTPCWLSIISYLMRTRGIIANDRLISTGGTDWLYNKSLHLEHNKQGRISLSWRKTKGIVGLLPTYDPSSVQLLLFSLFTLCFSPPR